MRSLIVSYSDKFGGAARSAYRIFECLKKYDNSNKMLVVKKLSNNNDVLSLFTNSEIFFIKLKNYLFIIISKLFRKNPISFNLFSSPMLKYINQLENFNIINLHWINAETLSILDINKINKPVVFTMHDMWYFTGLENYILDGSSYWIKNKIKRKNKFISRFFLKKKISNWKNFYAIAPSNWMKIQAKKSILMHNWNIKVIPYPIDLEVYKPKKIFKKNKNFKILFSAFGKLDEPRKGLDLLIESLNLLSKHNSDFTLVMLGSKLNNKLNINFKYENIDYVSNEKKLVKIYNEVDIVTIPSRIDNLPNVGVEAHACGKPIVAFKVGGLTDIVENNKTGFLVNPFNTKSFCEKLKILITNPNLKKKFSLNARNKAINEWSEKIIYQKYLELYKNINANN